MSQRNNSINTKVMKHGNGIRIMVALAIVCFCLAESFLDHRSETFSEFAQAFQSLQPVVLVAFVIWYGMLSFLTFNVNDIPLIGLLILAIVVYFFGPSAHPDSGAITLMAGVTLGKGTKILLGSNNMLEIKAKKLQIWKFLSYLVTILVLSSWWCPSSDFYHGPRWMGLWDNPNVYGTLIGSGLVLAIGLLTANSKLKIENTKLTWLLFAATGLMGVDLFFSYSRGAWFGTAIGLFYLAKGYRRFRWLYILPAIAIVTASVFLFWNAIPDSSPWYVKRLDFGRPSAQHRVAAWKAGFEMMRDYPFGVGWNKTVDTYRDRYSPPEDGATAINTNDYLMLGTQLGIPALLCFLAYNWLSFKAKPDDPTQITCRAGAVVLLVAFWFDGGLFKLPTAAVFWILLELGTARPLPNNVSQSSPPQKALASNI